MKTRRRTLCWLFVCLLILPMYGQAVSVLPVRGLFVHSVSAAGLAQDPQPTPSPAEPGQPVNGQPGTAQPVEGGQPVTGQPVTGQTNAGAFLSDPDTETFPRILMDLKVHDAQGGFIHGLTADQVSVLEDGAERPVSGLEALRTGAQVVVALNPGASFAIRNAKAVSRYDLIKDALRAWANSRMGSNIDDLSLLVAGGPSASHTTDPVEWLSALNSEQVDPRTAVPNLDVLFRAVSLASDPSRRDGMSRAVIFITPPPEGQIEGSLENLAAQARDSRTAIYVWLVASSGAVSTQSAQQLIALSQGTGGRVFTFSGEEPLPSLETYLAPLRDIYRLEYESGAASAGPHQVAVQVQAGEASVQSPPRSFEIDIQPPVPAFVSPPLSIRRVLLPGGTAVSQTAPTADESLSKEGAASPAAGDAPDEAVATSADEQRLQVVFDFPDGRKRPLAYSALLVDGVVTVENTAPPFDRFIWKLDSYTTSGLHRLQVQARDELGLTGASAELPVQITVEQSTQSTMSAFQRNLPVLSGLVALLAGAVLILVLVIGGQLRPRAMRAARRRRKSDPVTQPVRIHTEAPPARRAGWASRLQWPGKDGAPRADAYLNPLPDDEHEDTLPPIPISTEELTLGSDSSQAALLLDDPSVEPLHARLVRQDDGSYRLADEGSIAGTWINYTPVSKEGARLEHGDLIHVGRIGFRFTLREPARLRKPVIIAENPPVVTEEPAAEEEIVEVAAVEGITDVPASEENNG